VATRGRIYTRERLKDIGKRFGIGESGVSQACRRVSQRIQKDKRLRRKMARIEKELDLSRMKT
jgi:chromosomal replication initiation ATPase DnaA